MNAKMRPTREQLAINLREVTAERDRLRAACQIDLLQASRTTIRALHAEIRDLAAQRDAYRAALADIGAKARNALAADNHTGGEQTVASDCCSCDLRATDGNHTRSCATRGTVGS